MNKPDQVAIDEVPTADDIRGAAAEARGDTVAGIGQQPAAPQTPGGDLDWDSNDIEQEQPAEVVPDKPQTASAEPVNEEIRISAPKVEEDNPHLPAVYAKKFESDKGKKKIPELLKDKKTGKILKGIPQKTNKNGTAGRKPIIDDAVLATLRQAYLMDATDEEAAEFADIHVATLYNYQLKHPEFREEKSAWKQNSTMKARVTVYNNLTDPRIAAWYLERKKKDEFGTRTEVTGKDGQDLPPIKIEYVTPTDTTRINKDQIRGDTEAASGVVVADGSNNE